MTTQTAEATTMSGYRDPSVLVSTEWVAGHLDDPTIRIAECDEDILLYDIGHIPGAVKLDWHTDLQNQVRRDFVSMDEFERLMDSVGITNDTTVIFYGDRNNWYATYAFWLFKYYGHRDCRVMNGGRVTWEAEGRPYETKVPSYSSSGYTAQEPDQSIRAFRDDVMKLLPRVESGESALVDVRSPQEYAGELLAPPGYESEGAQRGGHIPTAQSIPWAQAVNDDGTIKDAAALAELYGVKGVTGDKETIAYCRIGERSAHTWFVLRELLGYPNVRNYDGSWTEWGNLIDVPIERGS
jgi:thiosulfate/3-mercaptopyruvate sulfurtransferase